VPDGDERVVEAMPLPPMVVHVASGHDRQPLGIRNVAQRAGQVPVPPHGVALQLDEEAIPAKDVATARGAPTGDGEALAGQPARQ
jgi:hypothetical protein